MSPPSNPADSAEASAGAARTPPGPVRRAAVLVALTLFLGVALAACDSGGNDDSGSGSPASGQTGDQREGGVLRFARSEDAEAGLNPIDAPNSGSIYAIMQIFDQLVEVTGKPSPQPGLAQSWETSDNGLRWTFHLRDTKFSNGDPVTAEDVAFSVNRFADPKVNVNYATLGSSIKSAQAIDPRTVRVTLKRVDGAFLDNLSMFAASIVPKKVVKDVGEKAFAEHPVGSGPFVVKEYARGQRIVFERNPTYWRQGQPKLDRVILEYTPDANTRILKIRSGEADVADAIPFNQVDSLENTEGISMQVRDFFGWDAVWFNTEESPLDELEVRKALNYATPKEDILKAVLFGNADIANSVIGRVKYWDDSVEPYPYDMERAKQLMAKSSVPDGFDLELVIPSGDPVEKQTAEVLKSEWAKIGVDLSIVQQDVGTLFTTWLDGKAMAATFPGNTLVSDTLSDDNLAFVFYVPATGLNSFGTGYSNPEVIKLVKQASGTLDEGVRAEKFAEAQQLALDDAPAVPLFFTKTVTAVRDNVSGFETYPTGAWPLRQVSLEK